MTNRRDWVRLFCWSWIAVLAFIASPASAQGTDGFALNRFEPAPAGDRFFAVQGADPGGHLQPRLMLLGQYAYRPLVLYREGGDERVGSIVSDQLFLHAAASLSLWDRLLLSVDMPFALVTEGDSPSTGNVVVQSPSGAAAGDLRLGARVRFIGEARGPLQLALAGYVWLPTGDEDKLAGDGSVRGVPALVLSGETDNLAYAVNAGVTVRGERQLLNSELGSELTFGGAIGLLLADRKLQIGPELYGATTLDDPFSRGTTQLEAIAGARYRAGPIVFGAGAGPGFTDGVGSPALRAVASVAFAPEVEKAAPADRDGDGIIDGADACPDTPGVASDDPSKHGCPPDRDGDGIADASDACPDTAGVASDDPDKHGCPPDRDGDGIVDADDACPDTAGEANDDPKLNGCPPDRDGDGVLDAEDACPDTPGVKTTDPETNGCPPDTDGDGIRDDVDACPREKGQADPDPKQNGCPKMVRVTESEIVIMQQVQFKTASDEILPASDELLKEVAAVLLEHPEILKVEVQGHTDDRGSDAYNETLSQRRATSVVRWLTEHGVQASRLTAKGYGEAQPIADNETEEGRQQNRRVQFKILETDKPTDEGAP
ncbi:MAG TPA: OmpA family protein [Polyangiaceae bacterium]|nr:OmpA family protein [Polyangiaceae bacterium]